MSEVFDLILRDDFDRLRPETFPVRDLANTLLRLEEAIASEASDNQPQIIVQGAAQDPTPLLALVKITPSSNCLTFDASSIGEAAMSIICRAVASGSLAGLRIQTQKLLWRLWRPLNERKISVEVRPRAETRSIPRFVLTREQPLPPLDRSRVIRSGTTIYGKVMRVGGKSSATAQIEASNKGGELLTVKVTKAQAEQLGHLLFKEVALKGTGEWRIDDMRIVGFITKSVLPIPSEDPIDVFRRLNDLSRSRLEGKDATRIVAELRGEDDEE